MRFVLQLLLGVVNLIEMTTIDQKIKQQKGNEVWTSDYDYRILKRLITKSKSEGKDREFIDILEREPAFPLNHCDFDVPEFGKKVVLIGKSNETGFQIGSEGYIIGILRHKEEVGRPEGWMEVAFSQTARDGNTYDYVYGLTFDDVDFV